MGEESGRIERCAARHLTGTPSTGAAPMKPQLLFVQGGGIGVHDEWDNKLVESLRRNLGPNF